MNNTHKMSFSERLFSFILWVFKIIVFISVVYSTLIVVSLNLIPRIAGIYVSNMGITNTADVGALDLYGIFVLPMLVIIGVIIFFVIKIYWWFYTWLTDVLYKFQKFVFRNNKGKEKKLKKEKGRKEYIKPENEHEDEYVKKNAKKIAKEKAKLEKKKIN